MRQRSVSTLAVIGVIFGLCVFSQAKPAAEVTSEMTPLERVKATAKGELKSPLTVSPEIIAEGKELYQAKTCGACHGGTGSGLHCPSLINDAWIYGDDDDTLFRLVTLGSDGMLSTGYARSDNEKHAGPMPSFSETIGDEQELWKIIAFIRDLKSGGADK